MSFYCDICGRESKKKIRYGGYTLCSKHMHQLHKYGHFLDNNPRTVNDLNEYRVCGDVTYFDLYSAKTSEKIAEFIIDTEDIKKVKYHKWRICHKHVVTGLPNNGTQRELSWVILGLDNRDEKNKFVIVDHMNGNGFDNRKCNLRICTQSENTLNKSYISNNTSGFIGVSKDEKRNRYDPEIRKGHIRCHLGHSKLLKEAVYKRYIAEELVFGEYANEKEHIKKKNFILDLPQEVKNKLESQVKEKLRTVGLWQ